MSVSAADKATGAFDHHSADYACRWREINLELRARCPVAHSDQHGGFYVLTRYADVARAIKDDATFASRHEPEPESIYLGIVQPPTPVVSVPIEMDPPEFFDYRRILNPHFSPAASERWRPFVVDVTTAMLDRVVETGQMDVVADLASPIPALLTAATLGLPLNDWPLYSEAYHAIVYSVPGTPRFDEAAAKVMHSLQVCAETVAHRRAEPTDDLLSVLATARVNDESLSDQRIMEICNLVLAGGNDTTTALVANAMHWLSAHPRQRAWLAESPERLAPACEEFLRYFTPTQTLARTVTTDVEIGGTLLHRGDRVLLNLGAANFDPEVFERPDEVVLDRFPNRHQAFGLGIHRCLGSNFTRIEFEVIIGEVLRRIPDFVVDEEHGERYETIGQVNGWSRMPMAFTPTNRIGGTAFTP
ncbi:MULTISPECIES: cytochrome P450 [unclassified Pseudofrankia]|uniref:cytochrome P450 n=1 Tax=unclassified Pseudofrankia TaxID=2994372 RepID=UPI0008D96FE6|nr:MULTISPECIES: cytochrome P450 [unclassified Pseudofrankia]MDT3441927.1 cytochrome P450 [Pseudofrankia sp. BMG5.37]OHV44569.1 hypothetical protein BCD48_25255 [Pseudofrankia sp. BMG5.36]